MYLRTNVFTQDGPAPPIVPCLCTDLETQSEIPFNYTKLLPAQDNMRLLTLQPASSLSTPLHGRLHIIRIDPRCEKYEALSYCWGDNFSPESLCLDGHPLAIGKNLGEALRRLRYHDRPRVLWIDAICINQHDDEEKTMQILRMVQIYSSAYHVMVWLGEDSEHEDGRILMELATDLSKISSGWLSWMKLRWYQYLLLSFGTVWDPRGSFDFCNRLVLEKNHGRYDAKKLSTLFFNRPWFGRRWVIQELLLAQRATLVCGTNSLDMAILGRTIRHEPSAFTSKVGELLVADEDNARRLMDALFRAGEPQHDEWSTEGPFYMFYGAAIDLLEFVHRFEAFQCRDARDRLAALLGLRSSLTHVLGMNYALSVEQNYVNFAKAMIERGFYMHMLLEATGRIRSPNIYQDLLPSWVPDWRLATRHSTFANKKTIWLECEAKANHPERIEEAFGETLFGESNDNVKSVRLPFVILDIVGEEPDRFRRYTEHGLVLHDSRSSKELDNASHCNSIQSGDLACFLGTDVDAALERYYKNRPSVDRACFILRKQTPSTLATSTADTQTYILVHTCNLYSTQAWKEEHMAKLRPYTQWIHLV